MQSPLPSHETINLLLMSWDLGNPAVPPSGFPELWPSNIQGKRMLATPSLGTDFCQSCFHTVEEIKKLYIYIYHIYP